MDFTFYNSNRKKQPFTDMLVKSEVDSSLEYYPLKPDPFCFMPNTTGVGLGDWLGNCSTRKCPLQKR